MKEFGPWTEAAQAYQSGDFQAALKAFLDNPSDTAQFHSNLGSTYFRLEDFGNALAHFEKAKAMDPLNSDISHNVDVVLAKLLELGINPLETQTAMEAWFEFLPTPFLLILFSVTSIVLLTSLIKKFIKTRKLAPLFKRPSGWITLGMVLIAVSFYARVAFEARYPKAILVETQSVRSGPGKHFLELAQLVTGSKVRFRAVQSKDAEDWVRVRYGGGKSGWLPRSNLLLL